MYDLIILGAGCAGLTAAIYAARAGLSFAVLEQDGWGGGQIGSAHTVQNYPGVPEVSGAQLGEIIREQAVSLGSEILCAEVEKVEQVPDGFRLVDADGEEYLSRTVIVAVGAYPRTLGVPGEKELTGAGVSYCAVCDGAFYAGKDVIVVGGGNTAVDDALYLSSLCRTVTVLLRGTAFRAAQTRVNLLKKQTNVTILPSTMITELRGDSHLEAVVLQGQEGSSRLHADGVFVAIGNVPASNCLRELPLALENGYIPADENGSTAIPGLFAAGDIRQKSLRQAITAAADGANAATSAAAYLK